jgi:ABC-type uncharacterized transport system substrate-binding protein
MNRRTFLCGLTLGTLAAPLAANAQRSAPPRRVGVLFVLLSPTGKEAQAFRQGLRDAGYAEGRDVLVEWRSANGDYARLPQLAADLIERKVDVIVADTTQATQAAQHASSTIPIVMAIVADPVGSGVVANLSRPGGNVTGLSIMLAELSAKRLQLLKETLPTLTTVVALWNPVTFGAVSKGRDALRNFSSGIFEGFADMRFEVKSRFVSADGKWGSVEWVFHGRQTKDFPGLPATNKPFQVRGSTVVEFRGGKI